MLLESIHATVATVGCEIDWPDVCESIVAPNTTNMANGGKRRQGTVQFERNGKMCPRQRIEVLV